LHLATLFVPLTTGILKKPPTKAHVSLRNQIPSDSLPDTPLDLPPLLVDYDAPETDVPHVVVNLESADF